MTRRTGRALQLGFVGVDSGMIAAIALDRVPFFGQNMAEFSWPGIVLKDGRHLVAGGRDFSHWDRDLIADTGLSANQLVARGLAVQVHALTKPISTFDYGGACNASLSRCRFGPLLDKTSTPCGFVLSTAHGDGAYPILRMAVDVGGSGGARPFVIVDTSASDRRIGSLSRPIIAIGEMRTGGAVLLTDPCSLRGEAVPVESDPLGWSTVYGVVDEGGGRISGLAFAAAT